MEEKIYFLPGDVVTLKQDLSNKPKMLVVSREMSTMTPKGFEKAALRGIKCRWFSTQGVLQEAIFNTKDLIKL